MVDVEKILGSILAKFDESSEDAERRLVFWYDHEKVVWDEERNKPSEELERIFEALKKKKIKNIIIDNNYFRIKKLLEIDDTESDYLVYYPGAMPDNYENWLLDMALYSPRFEAGKISSIKSGLGIDGHQLDGFLKAHQGFFAAAKRIEALNRFRQSDWNERNYVIGMLAVLSKSKTMNVNEIVRNILSDSIDEKNNGIWADIVKYELKDPFWNLMDSEYGFANKHPTLKKLLLSFIMTDLKVNSKLDLEDYAGYVNKRQNESLIFLNDWQVHGVERKKYDQLHDKIMRQDKNEIDIFLTSSLGCLEVDEFYEVNSIEAVDKQIIREIIKAIVEGKDDFADYRAWIQKRRDKPWWAKYEKIYGAAEAAIGLYEVGTWIKQDKLQSKSMAELYSEYISKYHLMDYHYRRFYYYLDNEEHNKKLKDELEERVENLYTNTLLEEFLTHWHNAIEKEMQEKWDIELVPRQDAFYRTYVEPIVKKNDRDKIAVIISDGMRYEAAVELKQRIDVDTKGGIQISNMLGVLPSYTKLGMACLLPHDKIEFKGGNIHVDGISSVDIVGREKILANTIPESMAVQFNDFVKVKSHDQRDLIEGKRVLYIYHNKIDATGDKPLSENEVFKATNEALDDIVAMVNRLSRSLFFTNVIVTSDHGFIYTRNELQNVDKLEAKDFDEKSALEKSKRFIVTTEKRNVQNAHRFDLLATSGIDTAKTTYIYVPTSNLRFKVQGAGLNYVHGGASPQETVIPVLEYKHIRMDSDLEKKGIKYGKVQVDVIPERNTIASSPFVVKLFQTEKVTDKLQPITLRIALWNSKDEKVSDEVKITFDSDSDNIEERQKRAKLTIASKVKNGTYYLKLIDDDSKALKQELLSRPYELKLIIVDDF